MTSESRHVVLFDGVCGLCRSSVRFIIRRDRAGVFRFASLQSDVGAALGNRYGVAARGLETLVLVEAETAYVRSDATLRIARRLGVPWSLLGLLLLIPRFIREPAYRMVSKYRYQWFGRFDRDWVPPAELSDRFL